MHLGRINLWPHREAPATAAAPSPGPPRLSPRIRSVDAPPILAAREWGTRYDGSLGPLVDLTQAVPGYPPHPELLERLASEAGSAATAGYGPINGEPALREALAEDVAAAYGGDVRPADVAVTSGCNLAFSMATAVLAGDGDAVMLPAPWFFNHRMMLGAHGVAAVPLPCRGEDGFLPDPERAAALWDDRVRAVVLCTPNNPTGAVYPPELVARFAALCRSRGAWLVLDETYRDFLPPGRAAPHGLFADPSWRDGVVHLYSFAKAYCVPGHRVGAVVAGPAVQAELMKAIDTYQICPPRAAQRALAWAVPALRGWREANRAEMARRAAVFAGALAEAPGWRDDARGTYFAYLRVPDGLPDAPEAGERLAAEHGLVALPGPFFGPGGERHMRVAFANASEESLRMVPGRLAALGAAVARAAPRLAAE